MPFRKEHRREMSTTAGGSERREMTMVSHFLWSEKDTRDETTRLFSRIRSIPREREIIDSCEGNRSKAKTAGNNKISLSDIVSADVTPPR